MKATIAKAFCRDKRGGNPAGVVLDELLTPLEMQVIASQLNFSETLFIQKKGDGFSALYYTPNSPIEFCGHASIAAFGVMRAAGLKEGHYPLQTPAGLCEVELTSSLIFLSQPLPVFGEFISPEEVAAALEIAPEEIQGRPQIVSTGLRDILVPICSERLPSIQPDNARILALSEKYDVVGLHLFSKAFTVRNFAPRYGIPEESATGSSNGALACYLFHHQISQQRQFKFLQGDCLNMPSAIHIRLTTDGNQIVKVECGGEVIIQGETDVLY